MREKKVGLAADPKKRSEKLEPVFQGSNEKV